MRQFWTNAKIWTVIAAVVAALVVKSELARRRRQLQSAHTRTEGAPVLSRSAVRAASATVAEDPSAGAPDRTARRRDHMAVDPPVTRTAGRRLPRAIVVAGIAVAALLPALVVLHPESSQAAATLSGEAADTPAGVMMMAHGSGFTPGQQVQLYWQHPGMGTVSTTASATGEVDAAVALPDASAMTMADPSGSLPLTATDGTNVATQAVALAAPSSSVLGAASERVSVNGAPYFLLGANYPWVSYGNDFGSNAWGSFGVHSSAGYAADFAAMKAKGVHVVRWWLFTDGRAGINYAADGTPLSVQPAVYDDLNAAIAMARQNDIYLDLVLFDFSLLSQPASVGGVQIGGRSSLISDPNKRTALVNNVIRPLAQAYGSEPMIASWELMNEPEWILSDLPQSAVNGNTQPVTMQQFWSYGSAASQMLHLYTQSMVTVGSASLKWNAVWTDAFAAAHGLPQLHLDFYQTHYYPWMDGWTINDPVLGHTTLSPLTQPVSGLNLDKPIVVGEISTPSGQAGSLLNTILNNGYAGFWGWSYNSNGTGDKLAIDWSTFTPWEQAHASAVRIPAPSGPSPASPTARASTATSTATRTAPTATRTALPKPPSATNTAHAAAPTATNTARPLAPSSTSTARPLAPTATKTATPNAPRPTSTAAPRPTVVGAAPIQNFGRITTAGFNDSSDSGYINGTLVALPSVGKLTSLSVYVGATRRHAHIRLAIYTDTGSAPGVLVAQTGPGNATVGWNTLSVPGDVVLKPGRYWIGALTDDTSTVYRMADGLPASNASGWSPQRYGSFPNTEHGWFMVTGTALSMFGTVIPAGSTAPVSAPTSTPTTRVPTSTPTRSVPTVSQPTAVSTMTNTPTPQPVRTHTPTPTATRPPAPTATATSGGNAGFDASVCPTKLDPLGRSQCGSQVHFCDTWVGGFCNDYRTKQTTMEMPFPQPGDATSVDCLSSTNAGQTSWLPYYVPTNNNDNTDVAGSQIIPFPCAISMNEHFMTRMEDGQFGMVVMRQQHPFDFAGRTGHIHFDVDLKTMERRYPRLVLSPDLTKMAIDDRNNVPTTAQSLEIWFRNGTFQVNESKNGQLVDQYPACNGCGARYYGQDNTRDSVDVYVSRTHIRIDINGQTQVDTGIADTGFDRAYVYLDHLNYNSCKAYDVEGYATLAECQIAGNTFHWDNIAFDGPTLPVNALTPAGSEDVVFNAWAAASCTVKGVAAQGNGDDYVWGSWVARLPAGTPVSASDVVCSGAGHPGFHWYQGVPMGLEIVKQ